MGKHANRPHRPQRKLDPDRPGLISTSGDSAGQRITTYPWLKKDKSGKQQRHPGVAIRQ